ncbi:hypothetical protein IH992_02000 [Candidatus Poribacteria bacterium]|nr:hypothetical protein [Candidatus Poribacteria bacterium]
MPHKWIVLIIPIVAIGVFSINAITQAQRPDRGEMRSRQGRGSQSGSSGGQRLSFVGDS